MKITFDIPDKVSGLLTVSIEEADYKDALDKELRQYRKKANIPGFRPGMVPMGLIKRQFGATAKYEVVNKCLSDNMFKYIEDNKIDMLGEPMASDKQTPVDLDGPAPYTFMFDIAVAPQFDIALDASDTIDYYTIKVDDKDVDSQVDMFATRNGSHQDVDQYEKNDMLRGHLYELDADGNAKTDGITVDDAVLLPEYLKADEQKKLFEAVKKGDVITFNPRKAYPESDYAMASLLNKKAEEVKGITSDFKYEIKEIKRWTMAPVDQNLFDAVYGKDVVKSETEFRAKITEGIKKSNDESSDMKFTLDMRKYCMDKVGDIKFPEALLKKMMEKKNTDKEPGYVDKYFDGSLKELKWQLIENKLAKAFAIKVATDDVLATAKQEARMRYASVGMSNVPDEYIDGYANELMKKKETLDSLIPSTIERLLRDKVKTTVKLNTKELTMKEFNDMIAKANKEEGK